MKAVVKAAMKAAMKIAKISPGMARGTKPLKVMKAVKKVALKKAAPVKAMKKAAPKPAPRAKGKAIAAKSFAAVAAKAKAAGGGSPPGEGKWYFMSDLRKLKEGADDPKCWTKYDAKMNKALEMAYTKNFKQYTSKFKDKEYIVKFKTMMQFRADDKTLQRPVKRE